VPHRNASDSFFIALNAETGVPSEINLLPPGAVVTTVDGRGPYRVQDAARLIEESLQASGGRMPIDENHSIDLAAPKGEPSPARGWMTGLQARADGIWAPVQWNDSGRQLLADKAYRGISVVFHHDSANNVTRILRAALTNTPNLRGLVALNSEVTSMEAVLTKLRQILGLAADAKEEDIWMSMRAVVDAAAAEKAKAAAGAALQSEIARAAGLSEAVDGAAVLQAVTALAVEAKKAPGADAIAALQSELKPVTTELNSLKTHGATERATAFVDAEIKRGRVGVRPLRDHYIAMHAVDPARVEKEIAALPILGPSGAQIDPPKPDKDGNIALNAEQSTVAKLLGVSTEAMAKTLAAEAVAAG
jgi:phage I-like protein